MSFYCPEIAVLQSAFALIEKQIGKHRLDKITKEKCETPVKIVCNAIDEIVNGLEEENLPEEQVQWKERLHDILLFKVCQSYDTAQPIIDENSVLDKTEMLAHIFPTFGHTLYIEVIKQCGWTSLLFARLDSLPGDTTVRIILDTLKHSSAGSLTDSDIILLTEMLDFLMSRLFTTPHDTCDNTFLYADTGELAASKNSLTSHVITTVLKTLNDYDLKNFCENVSNGNMGSSSVSKSCLLSCAWQLLFLGVFASVSEDLNINMIKKWSYLNVRGQEVNFSEEDTMPSQMFYKSNGMGKYSVILQKVTSFELNVEMVKEIQKDFPWDIWSNVITNLFQLDIFNQWSSDMGKTDLSVPTVQFSKCLSRIKIPSLVNKSITTTKSVNLACSASVLSALCYRVLSKKEELLPADVLRRLRVTDTGYRDFTMETVLWRIDNRQPGYQDCIEELLQNKYPDSWTSDNLIRTLENNLELLAVDETLTRMYDLVVELQDQLSQHEVAAVKMLVTSAFVKLPSDIIDRHIYSVYRKYRYWPSKDSVTSGEITAVFNKLTTEGSGSKVDEVFKQVLQNPEIVVENIVEKSITSKDQVHIYTEILKAIPSICSTFHLSNGHMSLLVSTLDNYLKTHTLGHKEQRNVLKFVMETWEKQDYNRRPGPLLDPLQFLLHTILPYLNVNTLYSSSQPITAKFAFKLFMEFIDVLPSQSNWRIDKEQEYYRKLLGEIDFPAVFLCVCELAHECLDFNESDEQLFSQKLKIREELCGFWKWLDSRKFIQEEMLQEQASWLEEEMAGFDFIVQLQMIKYISQEKFEKVFQNIWVDLLHFPADSAILNMIRMFSLSRPISDQLYPMLDGINIQYDYTTVAVSLAQVLPNLVDPEWEPCLSYIGHLFKSKRLMTPYKIQNNRQIPLVNLTEQTEMIQSQLLCEVTTLLQFTDIKQNKLALHHYLKCYVKFIKDYLVSENKLTKKSSEELSFLLSEVFSHIVSAICWMDELDTEPCNVILLDIVCRLEEVKIDTQYRKGLIDNLGDSVYLVKSPDTSAMIEKKLMEISKTVK